MIRIKICGVTRPSDVDAIAAFGADAIGLNFYPGSPRFVDLATAKQILQTCTTKAVGVFVESTPEPIQAMAAELPLAAVQTYREPPFDESFAVPHIPAFRVRSEADLASIRIYLNRCLHKPAAILIDSHTPHFGGSGIAAPWHLLAGFGAGVPLILAGGLTPHNVNEAIRLVRPQGVDVASGVESAPGVKDPFKVKDFLDAARAGFSAL